MDDYVHPEILRTLAMASRIIVRDFRARSLNVRMVWARPDGRGSERWW